MFIKLLASYKVYIILEKARLVAKSLVLLSY